jgi:hypothetical protein
MAGVATNLQVLKRTRRMPAQGDVFAMQLPSDDYLFGRVIGADLTDSHRAPMPGSNLIYVYRERSGSKLPDPSTLSPDQLLLPPVFTNRMPWTKGYFETLESHALMPRDLLPQHCFWDAARSQYVDEQSRVLSRESQPCGDWALFSYRWLDDQISDAVGIARVPD